MGSSQECLRLLQALKQSKEVTLLNLLIFYFTTQEGVDNKCVYCTTGIRMIKETCKLYNRNMLPDSSGVFQVRMTVSYYLLALNERRSRHGS